MDHGQVMQRTGYGNTDSSDGYAANDGYVANDKGYGGPNNYQAQGGYPAQMQGGNPVPPSYAPSTYGPNTNGSYQGEPIGRNEYVDRHGHVVRRKTRGGRFAACLALCWCVTWPCHGPCCGGL